MVSPFEFRRSKCALNPYVRGFATDCLPPQTSGAANPDYNNIREMVSQSKTCPRVGENQYQISNSYS